MSPPNSLRSAVLLIALILASPLRAGDSEVSNGPIHDGTEVSIDIPLRHRQQNTGGTDGSGLCVFATLQMAAWWQGITELDDLFAYMKTQPGGGWPERVDRILKQRAPHLEYIQYEDKDPAPLIEAAIKTGRPVCSTYGYGDFYHDAAGNRAPISHWILIVHFDANWAAIVDNNDSAHVTWIKRDEFLRRAVHPSGKAWLAVLMPVPPPPVPK
jgi:hypothetical protein